MTILNEQQDKQEQAILEIYSKEKLWDGPLYIRIGRAVTEDKNPDTRRIRLSLIALKMNEALRKRGSLIHIGWHELVDEKFLIQRTFNFDLPEDTHAAYLAEVRNLVQNHLNEIKQHDGKQPQQQEQNLEISPHTTELTPEEDAFLDTAYGQNFGYGHVEGQSRH